MGTTDKLVEDLLRKPPCSLREELVRNALAGHYHDYKSDDGAAPKVALITDLARFGYADLARRAARGEYDDEPDDADEAMLEQSRHNNPAIAALWEDLQSCRSVEEAIAAARKRLSPEDLRRMALEMGWPLP